MSVLCDALPKGLDDINTERVQTLRTAYEEWLDSQKAVRADAALHRAWVSWVLRDLLDMDKALKDGNELPSLAVTVAERMASAS